MPINRLQKIFVVLAFLVCAFDSVYSQTRLQDIFGRSLNHTSIQLVDWDGFMANPLLKYYLLPPTDATLPGTAVLTANGARLYFDVPSSVSSNGPSKSLSFFDSNTPVAFRISIFPAHKESDGPYLLTVVFTGNNGIKQTNAIPIQVIDFDSHSTNEFQVTANFDRDATGFFGNSLAENIVAQAANDWAYYFANPSLDAVPVNAEQTYIWSNGFNGGYYFNNTNAYTGYLLYAYGTTNAALRSGGEASFNGGNQTSGGIPLTIHRSGGFEANIVGNYNTLGWLFLTNDAAWLASDNYGDHTNDFFSIAHHEIGHALVFNEGHPGFATALSAGEFSSQPVVDYYGSTVPIDASSDHLTGVIDPDSGQGAFGYEYYGDIPRYRWTMTKIDLLCAQEVGYTLRSNAAFVDFDFPATTLPFASTFKPYTAELHATGGIPIYNYTVIFGSLPSGLTLDSSTGIISGIPNAAGNYNFSITAQDYHEGGTGMSQDFSIQVVASPYLDIALTGPATNRMALLTVHGTIGQTHVMQVSTNLASWVPLATNTLSTSNLWVFTDTNSTQFSPRYYRTTYTP